MKSTLTLRILLIALFINVGIVSLSYGQATSSTGSASSAAGFSSGTSCSATVFFGTPQSGGGVCVSKGVCGSSVDGINVTFLVPPSNPGIIMMTFSLNELKQKQPDQVLYFTDNSGTYAFDSAYSLSDPIFAPLNLPANAQILPTSRNMVQINGDIVFYFVQYSTGSN